MSFISKISVLFLMTITIWFSEVQAQMDTIFIESAKVYDTLSENEKKYKLISTLHDGLKSLSKSEIEDLSKLQENFILRLVVADYWKLKKDYEKAGELFKSLEEDLLRKMPIDYVLLAVLRKKSSSNMSFQKFDFKKGIEDLEVGLEYAKKAKVDNQIIGFHSNLSFYYTMVADYEKCLYHNRVCYDLAMELRDTTRIVNSLKTILENLSITDNSKDALKVWWQIKPFLKSYDYPTTLYQTVTDAFIKSKQIDSALFYSDLLFKIDSVKDNGYERSENKFYRGKVLRLSNQQDEAKDMFLSSYKDAKDYNNITVEILSVLSLAKMYLNENQVEKALNLLQSTYPRTNNTRVFYKAHTELLLSKAYEAMNVLDSALYYRNKYDTNITIENREIAEKQAILAKVELDVDNYIIENKSLAASNEILNDKVSKTTTARNILIYSLLALIVLTSFFFYQKKQKEKLRISQYNEQLTNKERMVIEAELNSIRAQMNPHFMFNSLNSINEFIQNDNSDEASNYLVKFSRLMRSTLNYSKRKFVTLKEEIDLLKLYLELENLRFYNSINYNFNIASSITLEEVCIPPMMLQPFVENAIWHGLMNKKDNRKLELRFYSEPGIIICEIEDNGIGRAASKKMKAHSSNHKSQGMGLTERRLELLKSIHGKEARVEVVDLFENEVASGTLVKVVFPKQSNS